MRITVIKVDMEFLQNILNENDHIYYNKSK